MMDTNIILIFFGFLPWLIVTVHGEGVSSQRRLPCQQPCTHFPTYEAINTSQVIDSSDIVHTCVNAFGAIRVVNIYQTCVSNTETAVPLSAGLTASANEAVNGSQVTINGPDDVAATGSSQPISVMQPFLSVNFIIALLGIFPSQNRRAEEEDPVAENNQDQQYHRNLQTNPFVGEIRMFAGNFAPVGWALCDGSVMTIAGNTALFSILGTTYGGDGKTNFALPDLRGRVPLAPSSTIALGQVGGSSTVTPDLTQLTTHSHTLNTVAGTLILN
jgi:microcystin-dependent protein